MFSPQLIQLLDTVPITAVRSVPGVVPRSIDVLGTDFRDITAVLINGAESPSFIVLSKNRLIAEVPDNEKSENIYEVMVMSASLTLTAQSTVEFTLGRSFRRVRGPQRLLQEFIRVLLRTPGSNKFHPQSGGGLSERVGKNMTEYSAADIAISINNTARYFVSKQTPVRSIPANERLLAAEVLSVKADSDFGTLTATVNLLNHSGQSAAATLIS